MAEILANESILIVIACLATVFTVLLAWRNWRSGDTESRAAMVEVLGELTKRFGDDQRPALMQEVEAVVDDLNLEERAARWNGTHND